jgi:glycosyltransferase involved in cell wall biosynthesis
MTKISIIAPNLNEEKVLPLFLDSLTNQSYKQFELIIVDGASSDKSLELITSYYRKLDLRLFIEITRNIGYIRNYGSKQATGNILFHTSSDTYLPPHLLENLARTYENPNIISISGRTYPIFGTTISYIAYLAFDLLRYLFTITPFPIHKYRPGGNFLTVRRNIFNQVKGFPEVKINEDGLFGQRLDEYMKHSGTKAVFHMGLWIGHHVKRFQKVGGIKSLFFYLYVFGNIFPFLKPLLKHVERTSGEVFSSRSDLKCLT